MRLKISLFYLMFYLAMGAFMPFLSLYFQDIGFSGKEIGIILAAGSLTSIIAQPIFGMINDAAKDYRTLLKLSTILSAVVVLGYYFSHTFLFILITSILFSFINTPAGPILDTIAIERGPEFGFAYGQIRVWGALGYAVSSVIAGYFFAKIGFQYISIGYVMFSIILFFMVFTFPKWDRKKADSVFDKEVLGALFRNKRYLFFIFIAFLVYSALTMNSSYLPIYFQKLHYPKELVGWNFAIAATVEIPLFLLSTKFIRKMGLFPMLIFATIVYAIKYIVMSFAPPVGAVLAVQALDGIAFAFYWSSAVEIVNNMAPDNGKTTAQALFGATGGIAGILANYFGGVLIDQFGAQFLYGVMGGITVTATLLFLIFPKQNADVEKQHVISQTIG